MTLLRAYAFITIGTYDIEFPVFFRQIQLPFAYNVLLNHPQMVSDVVPAYVHLLHLLKFVLKYKARDMKSMNVLLNRLDHKLK